MRVTLGLIAKGTPHRHIINDGGKRWIVRSGGSSAGRHAESRRAYAHMPSHSERMGGRGGRAFARQPFRVVPMSLRAPVHLHECQGCSHRRRCTRTDCAEIGYGTCSACRKPHMHHRHAFDATRTSMRRMEAPVDQGDPIRPSRVLDA